ncbi:MAG TPA: hypothetical protein PK876_07705 [Elusimicrobiota bacterium]|nr:hypothetical protein [Elusimicrobiota bacterium]
MTNQGDGQPWILNNLSDEIKNKLPTLSRCWEFITVFFLLFLFFHLTTDPLLLPANVTEMLDEKAALEPMGNPIRWFLGLLFPDRAYDYHSPVLSVFLKPIVSLGGNYWILFRLWPILGGVLILSITYLFVSHFFDKTVALLTLALLAIDPAYIMGTKVGSYVVSMIQIFSMGSLLLLNSWWSTKKPFFLSLAFLILGLGTCTRLWFLWFDVALFLASLFFVREFKHRFGLSGIRDTVRIFIRPVIFFFMGSLFLWGREFRNGFNIFSLLLGGLLYPSARPNNIDYWSGFHANIATLNQISERLMGDAILSDHIVGNLSYGVPFLWVGLTIGLLAFILRSPLRKQSVYLSSLFLLMLFQTPFTISINPTHVHLFFLFPFPQIIIASSFMILWRHPWFHPSIRGTVMLLLVCSLASLSYQELKVLRGYRMNLKNGEVVLSNTDSVYNLADWLLVNRKSTDHYFHSNTTYEPTHFIKPLSDIPFITENTNPTRQELRDRLDGFISEHRCVHVITPVCVLDSRDYTRAILQWAETNDHPVRVVRRFFDRYNNPTFEISLITKAATPASS